MVQRTLVAPSGILLAAAALAAWPSYSSLAPLGIRSQDVNRERLIYEFAFMFGALGVALASAARKGLAPWIEVVRPRIGAAVDAVAIGACGLVMAALSSILPLFFLRAGFPDPAGALVRAGGSGLGRALPLLAVASAFGSLAVRVTPRAGPAGWITALGSFALPALLPETHLHLRAASAAGALLLGAWLIDHPPEGLR
jgi:hypothetical protein